MCGVLVVAGAVVLWPNDDSGGADPLELAADPISAHVTGVEERPCAGVPTQRCNVVSFDVRGGERAGSSGSFETALDSPIRTGDDIKVTAVDGDGGATSYSFYDFQRATPLLVLLVLFVFAVVALGR